MSFDELKLVVIPFLSIFIPILIAYWCSRKTSLVVGLLTIGVFYALIAEYSTKLLEVSPNFVLITKGAGELLTPIFSMLNGVLLFVTGLIGLDGTIIEMIASNGFMGYVIIFGALWVVFFVIGILARHLFIFKLINRILCGVLGLLLFVILIMFFLSKDGASVISPATFIPLNIFF